MQARGLGRKRRAIGLGLALAVGFVAGPSRAVRAEVVEIPVARDATLIEHPAGALANGAGPALFAGRTGQASGSIRRALLAFDVASRVPRRARITSAWLTLFVDSGHASASPLALHRVLAAWEEGSASASGGRGASAGPGDTTWLHRVFPDLLWQSPGGDVAPVASALATPPAVGPVTWLATGPMRADLQRWLEDPGRDHGWLLRGDESTASTVQRLASREDPDPARRPVLWIEFERRDEVCAAAGHEGVALALCQGYCETLGCDAATTRGAEPACVVLARAFERVTGGGVLPCGVPGD